MGRFLATLRTWENLRVDDHLDQPERLPTRVRAFRPQLLVLVARLLGEALHAAFPRMRFVLLSDPVGRSQYWALAIANIIGFLLRPVAKQGQGERDRDGFPSRS